MNEQQVGKYEFSRELFRNELGSLMNVWELSRLKNIPNLAFGVGLPVGPSEETAYASLIEYASTAVFIANENHQQDVVLDTLVACVGDIRLDYHVMHEFLPRFMTDVFKKTLELLKNRKLENSDQAQFIEAQRQKIRSGLENTLKFGYKIQ